MKPVLLASVEELKTNPAIVEHWPQVASLVEGHLLSMLVKNSLAAEGTDRAQAELGGLKAIATMIESLRTINPAKPEMEKRQPLKPLNRYQDQPETAAKTPHPKT